MRFAAIAERRLFLAKQELARGTYRSGPRKGERFDSRDLAVKRALARMWEDCAVDNRAKAIRAERAEYARTGAST
jgi:hypothetical protein